MNNTVKVTMNDKDLTVVYGTKISELFGRVPHSGPLSPLGAVVNRRLTGLYHSLTSDSIVNTVDYSSKYGADIYRRSANILLYAVVGELYPNANVVVSQSIGGGYFFTIEGETVTSKVVERIEKRMEEYVQMDVPFMVERVFVDEAVHYFSSLGDKSKAKVHFLTQMPRSEVTIVTLLNFRDLVHGPVALSSSALKNFQLVKYHQGLLMSFPDRHGEKQKPPDEKTHNQLFEIFMETRRWNELMGVATISGLNDTCIRGTVSDLIKVSEALHEKKIAEIADKIANSKVMPKLILVAGPSASGKTTFSKRLTIQLRVNGITPKTISLDNYYIDRDKTPKHPDGSYDFESIYALDLPLLNEHLAAIITGARIEMPAFSFETGKRKKGKSIPIQLEEKEVLIIEGIHALNDMLHEKVANEIKFKVFVSALTQLSIDEHNRVFTSDTRLLRRMVRDRLYRGYNAAQTLNGWLSVRGGEDNYIFPFQNNADVFFNSALVYEHAVLTPYAKRFLMEVSQEDDAYTEAVRLYQFIDHFIPIMAEEVPPTSVLREFIGGSTFRY